MWDQLLSQDEVNLVPDNCDKENKNSILGVPALYINQDGRRGGLKTQKVSGFWAFQ